MVYLLLKGPFFIDRETHHQAGDIARNRKQKVKRNNACKKVIESRIVVGNKVHFAQGTKHKITDAKCGGTNYSKLNQFF